MDIDAGAYIEKWSESRLIKQTIDLHALDHPKSHEMEQALRIITDRARCIRVRKKKDPDNRSPYIQINKQVRFKAIPRDKLLMIFMGLLAPDAPADDPALEVISVPVFLKVYISPQCPFCPSVVQLLFALTRKHSAVHLEIIDGTLFDNEAAEDAILAAPTVICDGTHRLTGSISEHEIMDVICQRKPQELSADSLQSMIEAGQASYLAEMMIRDNTIYPSFYELLVHEKWPLRLGAMVAVETLAEKHAVLAETMMEVLWDRFDSFQEAVKGDLLYLAGMAGGPAYADRFKTMLAQDLDPEFHDMVEEALLCLGERIAFRL